MYSAMSSLLVFIHEDIINQHPNSLDGNLRSKFDEKDWTLFKIEYDCSCS